ncbi:hypothetical protein AAJ72_04110 [Citromicrobium sp. RCC1885]|uniref:hypothetical protein n=1 Tax=unclassified Citromicrobium TaxID=2630544 RepID=UPI0006C8EB74|nr:MULTISPECIES: hypothetical protein [unclassified Citromicrobium]KPM24907.1 hypothetical protein AAJ72_04110 [Citromicrobium sp. RCC1885]KPM28150.1 hypothetical protein AAJ74_04855 [Citromicrobium sp. RCC1878]MAO03418.1 hypothetical protein [Citromicrobium sp.]OAM10331.1 hypothetical protein A0U43_04555 [Citromicrobium sp. RCC1897]|tara:strand:- start:1851 stop:3365 length:1515 start_codon:yes stop_codon:yes gene_type:complete
MVKTACLVFTPLSLLAMLAPANAFAQPAEPYLYPQEDVANAICRGIESRPGAGSGPRADVVYKGKIWRAVPDDRVAFYILSFLGEAHAPGEALAVLRANFDDAGAPAASVYDSTTSFATYATSNDSANLRVFGPAGFVTLEASERERENDATLGDDWFLEDRFVIRCAVGQPPVTVADGDEAPSPDVPVMATPARPSFDLAERLRLRGSVKDLSASGAELKKASAASIGLARSRKFQSDGSRVETDTLAINAFLGLDLSSGANGAYPKTLLFAGYERNSARSEPAPALTPPATERDSDTDVLQFGLQHSTILPLGRAEPGQGDPSGPRRSFSTSAALTVDGAYLFDLVKDSERFRMDASMDFYHRDGLWPLCGIGVFDEVAEKFWTRCSFSARADWNFITREGRLTNIAKTEFGHIGGRLGFDAIVGTAPSGGPFIALEYMNLQRIAGDATFIPDIERHGFAVGYRWWTSGKVGIEAKTSLTDGVNPDSLVDENELSVSFGLIF